jgi:mannobiose 2-epimerase
MTAVFSCRQAECAAPPHPRSTHRDTIAAEIRRTLDEELRRWYPLCVDTVAGGYVSDLNADWLPDGPQNKMIVTQARHIWSAAHAGMFYQKDNALRRIAAHGVDFLARTMWDSVHGGFFDLVERRGMPIPEGGRLVKKAYGQAFALYALAEYSRASGDTAALDLARKTHRWLEAHSYDPRHGGYFQFLSLEGDPFVEGVDGTPPKDYNSMIHLLEAYTAFYAAWPDSVVRDRLSSLLTLVRDTLTTDEGFLRLYFRRDWTPVTGDGNVEFNHISFGHDAETAYLLLEASEALGTRNDSTTLRVAKSLLDHAIRYGWDQEHGGLFDAGTYDAATGRREIVRRTKEWWAQAEALNALLLMADLFPDDPHRYYDLFCSQWAYCTEFVIDPVRGGWYWGGIDAVPSLRESPKASIWKGAYHTSRALINCVRRLTKWLPGATSPPALPVNPTATAGARQLLATLHALSGTRTLAGHHHYVGAPDRFISRVKELTGKSPALWGNDFGLYYTPGYGRQLVQEAYAKYREGFIISLMWHAGRPQDDPPFGWKESVQAKLTDAEWAELTTPGTRLHTRWLRQVDSVAQYLQELQVLGVPVLWRPYHELNGVWFWWGNRKGPAGSALLYRMMFDRFVHHHHLDNLLWVWNANAPRQLIADEAWAYEDFFPGLDCVDVLGADVYHNDWRQSHHDELAALGPGKVIALAEVGQVPTPEILARQPLWAWFMIWGTFVDSHNSPQSIRDLYNDPRVLSHEEYVSTGK